MFMIHKDPSRWFVAFALFAGIATSPRAMGQGLIIPTAGPINSSMAGASTAAPIDFGSSYWNPATISGLDRQEFLLGSALIFPSIHFGTDLPAGSVGPFPRTGRYGLSRSNSGVSSNLATGTAFKLSDDSDWTLGLGVFGLAGGGVNFAGSSTQPLLTPRNPPKTFGVGPIYSNISMLEITPIASYQATDRLAIAAGPIITTTAGSFSPAFFAPNQAGPFGLPTFPAATNSRPFWGGGFQAGLFLNLNENWNFGFSYKSPIWQERWSYNAATPSNNARYIGLQASMPEIISWGIAYKGFERTLIDVDLRYFDYKDAALFGQSIQSGGLNWRSVFAVATGVQYQLSEKMTIRGGFLYNTNPIPSTATLFNVQAPAITQYTLSFGASYRLTTDITATAAWVHGFRNAISGGVEQLPGAISKLDTQTDSLVFGLNIQFGRPRKARSPQSPGELVLPATLPPPSDIPLPKSPVRSEVIPASTQAATE